MKGPQTTPQVLSSAMFTTQLLASFFHEEVAFAAVFDLKKDWNESRNPNGVWTLLAGSEVMPRVAANTAVDSFSPTQGGWGYAPIPFWFKSTSTPLFTHDWRSGDIIVHTQDDASGPGYGPASVIWTSPLSGHIEISGSVWECRDLADLGGWGLRGNQWNLYIRDVQISSGMVGGGDPYSSDNPFPLDLGTAGADALKAIPVSTNDVVRLELIRTTFWGDYVGVNLQISTDAQTLPVLTIIPNADRTMNLSWSGTGILEQTESLATPNWQPSPNQANPQTLSTTNAVKLFRVKAE